jgi:arylsulfatase A-like enzyme
MKPKLKYIGLSLLVGTAALICAVSPVQAADKKPNILVIWGDDIGIHNISAYNLGVMGYHTRSIDRIAKEGALFTDAYAQQSCTAGRASLHPGAASILYRLVDRGFAWFTAGDSGLGADNCRPAQATRLHHGPQN